MKFKELLAYADALGGAEMVLGLLGYQGSGMNKYSRDLFGRFEEKVGATICADIKGFVTGRTLCSCEDCCRFAVEAAEEVMYEL